MKDLTEGSLANAPAAGIARIRGVTNDSQRRDQVPSSKQGNQAGGHGNFDSFYAENRDQIARALSLSLRNPDLGAEAADEAFVRACQRWPEVATFSNPRVGFTE